MASIHLFNDCPDTDTRVPNEFIDNYMPQANGEFVKVYLYLLRKLFSNSECSVSDIADTFNHTEADVMRALKYWERQCLLSLVFTESQKLCEIHFLPFPAAKAVPAFAQKAEELPPFGQTTEVSRAIAFAKQANPAASSDTAAKPERKREFTLDEIRQFQNNPDISELFFIIETYLKHPLSTKDTGIILSWYQDFAFSTDLIEYLVEYCVSQGHSSIYYMDKVAIAWKEQKITTVLQAKENSAIHNQLYYAVMKSLGISGRNLVEFEIELVSKWSKEYLFDTEIIQEACRRTIAATHQPSFTYADKILTNWYKNHVHTLTDIQKLDQIHKDTQKTQRVQKKEVSSGSNPRNKFNNFNQRNYDYEQLEKVFLTTSVN